LVQADGCNKHAEWLSVNALDDLLVLAESSNKPQLCSKARALVSLLSGEEPTPTAVPVNRVQAPTPSYQTNNAAYSGEVDLLGGFADSPPPPEPSQVTLVQSSPPVQPPPQALQVQTPASSGPASSLFGNLTVKSNSIPPQPPAPQPQNQSSPAPAGGMFGGLSVKPVGTTQSQLTQAPHTAPLQPSATSAVPAPAPAPLIVHDPFGFADLSAPAPSAGFSSNQPQMNQPMNQPQMNQPMNQPQMNQPMNLPQINQPMYQPQMNQPMNQPQMTQPMYQPQMNQPMYQMNPHMSQMSPQMMNQAYPGQNMNSQPGGYGMNQQQQMMGQQPMNQMQYQQMMMQMNQMNMNGQGQYQQRVPMKQGMMSPIRSATASIPDADALHAMGNGSKVGSGFDFMGSANRTRGQSADQKEDAFSFVKDSMKAK
jgi:hypothetical protein